MDLLTPCFACIARLPLGFEAKSFSTFKSSKRDHNLVSYLPMRFQFPDFKIQLEMQPEFTSNCGAYFKKVDSF